MSPRRLIHRSSPYPARTTPVVPRTLSAEVTAIGRDDPHPAAPRPADSRADDARFRTTVLVYLDAAHNLAWWMTRNDHDAADAVQESFLKAWRAFPTYRGGDAKSWLLSIVRNTIISRLRSPQDAGPLDDGTAEDAAVSSQSPQPIDDLLRSDDRRLLARTIAALPVALREVLVLRDVEGLTYAQIAEVLDVPIGTVMSRLSRARDAAREALSPRFPKDQAHGL